MTAGGDVPAAGARGAGDVVDLRLGPAAVGCWAGAALAVAGPVELVRPAVSMAVGAAAVLAATSGRRARTSVGSATGLRRAVHGRGRPTAAASAGLALLVFALTLLGGSVQRAARLDGLLGVALRDGATVALTGSVVDGPVPVADRWGDGEQEQRYTLAVRWVESRGQRSGAAASVIVVGPGDVRRGSSVRVGGRLAAGPSSTDRAVASLHAGAPAQVVGRASWPERAAEDVRAATGRVAARLPGDPGALLLGMALGDTSRVSDDLTEAMRGAGLTHLIAVSGSHFALIGALVAAAAAACRLPRVGRAGAVLAAGAALLLLVGPQPSVLRAAVTGTVGVLGLLAGRPARAPAALAATVVALLLVDPWLSLEIGFVLSVVATAAIVLLGAAWVRRWSPRLGRPLATVLAAPLAAQLACAPVLLVVQPSVGTYGLIANLVVAPAVPPATILGVLTAVVSPWCPQVALVLAHLAGAACWWVAAVAHAAASAPGARLAWAPGAGGIVAMTAVCVATGVLLVRRRTPSASAGDGVSAPSGRL